MCLVGCYALLYLSVCGWEEKYWQQFTKLIVQRWVLAGYETMFIFISLMIEKPALL